MEKKMNENVKKKKDCKLFAFFKQNSDTIQVICSLISTIFIGVCSLILANRANQISETQFYYSTQPYFTILEVGDGGLEEFQICNEGGYIQNASLELVNILKIDVYSENEFVQTMYVPFGSCLKDIYDAKNKLFTISNPQSVMEASEVENRLYSYYLETEYDFVVSRIQYLTLVYLDCNRNYKEEMYLICMNPEIEEYSLMPLKEDLLQSINDHTPDVYKDKDVVFPKDAIWTIKPSSGRGVTRTFSRDAETMAEKIIEEVNQIIK